MTKNLLSSPLMGGVLSTNYSFVIVLLPVSNNH